MIKPLGKYRRTIQVSPSLDRLCDFDRELLRLRAEGFSYPQISEITGANKSMLSSRVRRLASLPEKFVEDDKPTRGTFGDVPKSLDEMGEKDRILVTMYLRGDGFPAIADEMDLNRKTVSDRVCRLRAALGKNVIPHLSAIECARLRNSTSPQPERIKCLCCGRTFESWCRKRNRICVSCKSSRASIHDLPEFEIWA